MYVMTQFHYYPCNLATTKVSKLKFIFVTQTQTIEHVAMLNFSKIPILNLVTLTLWLYDRNILYYL